MNERAVCIQRASGFNVSQSIREKTRELSLGHGEDQVKKMLLVLAGLMALIIGPGLGIANETSWKSLYDQARKAFSQGHRDQALVIAGKSMKQAGIESGAESLNTLKSLILIGDMLLATGDYSKSSSYYKSAFDLYPKVFGEMHPNTARLMKILSANEITIQDAPKAKEILAIALEINELSGHSQDPCSSECLTQCLIQLSGKIDTVKLAEASINGKR